LKGMPPLRVVREGSYLSSGLEQELSDSRT